MSKIKDLIQQHCPNGVEYKKLGEIFNYFSGMTGVSNKWKKTGNCKFIDYLNVYNNMQVDVSALKNATVKNQNQNILQLGDILLTCASETPDECAVTSVIRDKIAENTFLDDHLFALRTKEEYKNIIDTAFYNYYFHSIEARREINKTVRGVTRFYIAYPSFMKLPIPLPPLVVQQEIVRILDKFTALEAELEAELEARKKQYQYYRDKLLSFEHLGERERERERIAWRTIKECVTIINASNKVNKKSYLKKGKYPIIDQGQQYIIAYTNDITGLLPLDKYVIFGEHTKEIKYVDFQFVQGADGLKILKSKDFILPKYLYYCMQSLKIPNRGYNRHWTVTAPLKIPIPSLEEQERIVRILDKFERLVNDISVGLPAEIKARRQQYEYYRDKLLSFEKLG